MGDGRGARRVLVSGSRTTVWERSEEENALVQDEAHEAVLVSGR